MNKLFIVGVPRSGTTLIQSIIAAHPEVYATRETHFMTSMRRKDPNLKFLDHFFFNRNNVKKGIQRIASRCPDLFSEHQTRQVKCYKLSDSVKLLDKLFTTAALNNKKTHWVEKSPEHVGYVDLISKYIKQARFIHSVRDPRDNIASLYDAGKKYPEDWKKQKTLQGCIDTYKMFLSRSVAFKGKKCHFFLYYEKLIEEPEQQIEALYTFASLYDFVPRAQQIESFSQGITNDRELWKKELSTGIHDTRLIKYNQLFDDSQKETIEEQTRSLYQQFLDAKSNPV